MTQPQAHTHGQEQAKTDNMKTTENQTESISTRATARVDVKRLVSKTFCGRCDGVGRIRANYTSTDRGYVFRKTTCPDCNGTGEGDACYC